MAAAGGGGGGAGTGGKIRTRRYHLSSGRTPYSKSRQQGQQQGIISRVTDTVKSIVPGWLQRYFNKKEGVPGRSANLNRVEDHVDDRQNEEQSQIYVQDDLPTAADGRVTPEPVRTHDDQSSSRLTLNLPDVLARPSLHRSNLNFNILDSPALNCQPSTSSHYPIGTSNFSLVKEIKDSTSQHDDDNISTTSGFSSRASDKDIAVTKSLNAPPLWSPEADRSHNLSQNSSMNSRRPTFNLSTFGTLSPSLGNSSVLKSSQLGDSPFYPGKTTYGGAAAARTSRIRSTPYQAPIRRQVKPKPANNQSFGVTSSTARRILQSLEKMSSPLADAKRIPSASSPSALTPDRSVVDVADGLSKRKKVEASYPPVKKLVTPKSVSVSSNASLYIKPSLTPSSVTNTSSRRTQGIDKHREPPKYHAPEAPTPQHTESFSYPRFSTPASNGFPSGRGGGKMMRDKGTHYSTKSADEEVEAPDLPEISLPISTTALPKISFGLQTKTTPPAAVSKSVFSTPQVTNSTGKPEFTFSSPIVKSTESNAQSPGSSGGFTFSVPALKASSVSPQTSKMPAVSNPVKSPVAMNSSNTKKTEEEYSGFCKPAKTLKEGSVLDILKSPGFSASTSSQPTATFTPSKSTSSPLTRPPAAFGQSSKQALGIWYCSKCLIDNKASDSKCASCSAAKELPSGNQRESASSLSTPVKKTTTTTSMQGFGDLFKKAPGTWDCDTCLVQNKSESTKCIACETPKPGTEAKAALLLLPTTKSDRPAVPADNGLTSASRKFEELARKPMGSWECDVCLVQNKAEDGKCIACTTPKPGMSAPVSTSAPATQNQLGLLDQFKKSAGTWDCDVCLVNNKPEAVKCVACQSAKPGSKTEPTGFGTSGLSESTLPAVKFGLPSSSNSGELKSSASTDSLTSASGGFSFPKFTGEIKFGISSSSSKSTEEKKDAGFKFGTATEEKKETGFTFGTPSSTNSSSSTSNLFCFGKPAEKDATAKPLSGDTPFGSAPSALSSAPKPETSEGPTSNEKSNLTVSFGFKEPEEKKETPVASGFTFGKTEQKETTSPFAFGKKDEKSETSTTAASVFGSKNEGEQPKPFLFGKPEAAKADAPSVSFTFGVPNTAEKKDADQAAKPVFSFGLPTQTTANTGATKVFGLGFQSNGSSTTTQPSSIGSSGSAFGSVQQPSTQTSTSGIFGSSVLSNSTSVPSGFGSSAPASAPPSTGFSTSAALPAPTGSTSLLSSATALNTPANSSSIFGSAAPSIAASSSSSVFGSAAPVNTTSTSSVFGASTNTSASSSSLFGNPNASSNSSATPFVFGQPATTASTSLFGNPNESKSSFVFSGQEGQPVVTSTSTAPAAAAPFVFGASAQSTPAAPGFNFTGANASNVPGTSSSPFIFGAAAAPAVTATSVPAFGKPASQANAPSVFGSSTSTSLFPSSSQNVPAFGSLSSNVQAPVFGQQSAQPAFGSSAAPASGSGFPFGSSNFNFASGNSPGVFQFGGNSPSTPAQPANSSFAFNQAPPSFNMGANGRTATPSTISNRKIKTARRRK